MNLKEELLHENSKLMALRISAYALNSQAAFRSLMKMVGGDDRLLAARASWPLTMCIEAQPRLAKSDIRTLVDIIDDPGLPEAVLRNVTRSLQFVSLPGEIAGKAVTICFRLLSDPSVPVASRCNALTILMNICKLESAFVPELVQTLELIEENPTPALIARIRKTRKWITSNSKY